MSVGKLKIEAQRKNGENNGEKNQKPNGSQSTGPKVIWPFCKVQQANEKQLVDHYASKHPKEKPPSNSG